MEDHLEKDDMPRRIKFGGTNLLTNQEGVDGNLITGHWRIAAIY